jgi:hypothetical protein
LSNGVPFQVEPASGATGAPLLLGSLIIATDPLVEQAGVDVGYAITPNTMRAPDISVGHVPDRDGWVPGVPPLAIEYAASGQDEHELTRKIADLLGHGTQAVWVVRLSTPRHVEVWTPGNPMQVAEVGDELTAPGILARPVPVAALFDRRIARDTALGNLLAGLGYPSLDAVREEGRDEGRDQGMDLGMRKAIRMLASARFGAAATALDADLDAAPAPALERAVWLAANGGTLEILAQALRGLA